MLTNPLLAFAMGERNYEDSKRKSNSIKSKKQQRFAEGKWPGGTPSDGYMSVDGKLVIDPARAPIIDRMFQLADEGLPRNEIVRKLNGEGHRTRPAPKGKDPHDGLPWTNFRVGDVLSNQIYAARLVMHRGTGDETPPRPGSWEPLVDPALLARAQAAEKLASLENGPIVKAMADMISGQIGGKDYHGRAMTAGAGTAARY